MESTRNSTLQNKPQDNHETERLLENGKRFMNIKLQGANSFPGRLERLTDGSLNWSSLEDTMIFRV